MSNPILETAKKAFESRFTVDYPDFRETLPDNYRGIHRLDMKTCINCSACAHICPNQTITMVTAETERGPKVFPEINLERCLFCELCEEVCPTKCLVLTKNNELEAYDRRELIKRPEELE